MSSEFTLYQNTIHTQMRCTGTLLCILSTRTVWSRHSLSSVMDRSGSSNSNGIPSLPGSILTEFGRTLRDSINNVLGPIQEESSIQDELRDSLFRETKSVLRNNAQIFFLVRTGDTALLDELIAENKDVLEKLLKSLDGNPSQPEGRLSQAIEKFTEARLLQQFFSTGKLVSPDAVQPCSDDEYIGAALGFAQELARYVVGRASEGDMSSVSICRTLVSQLNGKMLEFDFRNGPLRRKYDGLKYAAKTIEDITYETSLLEDIPFLDDEMPSKRQKTDGSAVAADGVDGMTLAGDAESVEEPSLIDVLAINAIRDRMETYDKLREDVIKQSRDVQKLSKLAIYSVHRGALGDSKAKLDQAMKTALKILEIVNLHPGLRPGAFSNSLEEWAEGALTLEWVLKSRVMTLEEMKVVSSHEYIGALSDFTGEIGRFAVVSAAKRDVAAVRRVLQADVAIAGSITLLNTTGKYTQKANAVMTNMKKIEDIVYELSMLQRGGRIGRVRDPEPKEEPAPKNDDN